MYSEIIEKAAVLRRTLHGMPETSMEETETRKTLMRFVRENTTFEVQDRGSWFYCLKRADAPDGSAPAALRADFDAVCAGGRLGHFCGHDGHSAVLCAAAMKLSAMQTKRDIYLIFQPGEEIGRGALLCRGLIDEKNIGEIYGLHNIPGYPTGEILLRRGTFACASTGLEIKMLGRPSHAAYPEAGRNPGFALSELLLSAKKTAEKMSWEHDLVMLTLIGMDVGGESYGVSASEGTLRLTLRGEREKTFEGFLGEIKRMARESADRGGFELRIREIERFPATENDDRCVEKTERAACRLGLSTAFLDEPMRWSEDFGAYLQKTKGAFFGVGSGENHAQLHTENYVFPDEIIDPASELLALLASDEAK